MPSNAAAAPGSNACAIERGCYRSRQPASPTRVRAGAASTLRGSSIVRRLRTSLATGEVALAEDFGPRARRDRRGDLGRSAQGSNAAVGPKDRPGAKVGGRCELDQGHETSATGRNVRSKRSTNSRSSTSFDGTTAYFATLPFTDTSTGAPAATISRVRSRRNRWTRVAFAEKRPGPSNVTSRRP